MSDPPLEIDEMSAALRAHLVLSSLPSPPSEGKQAKKETATAIPKKQEKGKSKKEKKVTAKKPVEEPAKKKPYERFALRDDATVDYGYLAAAPKSKEVEASGGYYITTAINYTNGPPHMGHAYEATTSDVLARFSRVRGVGQTYFVTGADEHGQKIANTAADQGMEPVELCDKYVNGFMCLNQRILISSDDYVRTTSDRHKRTSRELWKRCAANGDIHLDTYEGWYNVREETFVTDSEAARLEYKDETSGQPLKRVEEASYFFKMSAYHDRLVQHIQDNPNFIRPESHRNQILARLAKDRLRDLSVSRTTFAWGIPVPEGFDLEHVMYVWFDALTNYLTGVDGLGVNDPENGPNKALATLWPADVHIIGKDILWFHTVIWPCILMSAGVPLPKTVFAHGFVNDREGKKMSKSVGNVVDPHDMLDKYPVDTFRWYLCKEAPYGGELSFNEESLRIMHNADLCDTIGNLVRRVAVLCKNYCDDVVPDVPAPDVPPVDFGKVRDSYVSKMENFELEGGASVATQAFHSVNIYLQNEAPWKLEGDEHTEKRKIIVRTTLEAVYALTHLIAPFLPNGSSEIFKQLNTSPKTLAELGDALRNLKVGTKIEVGDILYKKLLSEEEIRDAAEASKKKTEAHAEASKRKKEKKAKEVAASKAGQKAAQSDQPEFTKMDIRVGKIVKVWHHPDADKLFCEEIDVGEEDGPRQIASGLRDHYELSDMKDRGVLVVCNLKPSNMRGFTSRGMVLAAKSEDGSKVELIDPPEGATIGERVFIEGLNGDPFSAAQVKKKKTWDAVAKGLKTADGGVATWDGKEILTSAGHCRAASVAGAPIS